LVRLPPEEVERVASKRKGKQNEGMGREEILRRIGGLAQYHPTKL
jgi:hypothetical protein